MPPRLAGDGAADADSAGNDAGSTPDAAASRPGGGGKETKKGKPPLIVFLPDGKGYVLPPFRDIQQVSFTTVLTTPKIGTRYSLTDGRIDGPTVASSLSTEIGKNLDEYERNNF